MPTTFERVISGELPGSFVHRDDRVVAFMSLGVINDEHCLVVPMKPASCLAELDEETASHSFAVALRIAAAIRETDLKCEGVNLFLADGAAAGQDVFHVHLHVIPRYEGDEFDVKVPERFWKPAPREVLDRQAAKIRRSLETLH
jgi:histidine triad (HIT) family protein